MKRSCVETDRLVKVSEWTIDRSEGKRAAKKMILSSKNFDGFCATRTREKDGVNALTATFANRAHLIIDGCSGRKIHYAA
jgi:hypothetical protein